MMERERKGRDEAKEGRGGREWRGERIGGTEEKVGREERQVTRRMMENVKINMIMKENYTESE